MRPRDGMTFSDGVDLTSEALAALDDVGAMVRAAATSAAQSERPRLAGDLEKVARALGMEAGVLFELWLRGAECP